jgi:hypothetical protein
MYKGKKLSHQRQHERKKKKREQVTKSSERGWCTWEDNGACPAQLRGYFCNHREEEVRDRVENRGGCVWRAGQEALRPPLMEVL